MSTVHMRQSIYRGTLRVDISGAGVEASSVGRSDVGRRAMDAGGPPHVGEVLKNVDDAKLSLRRAWLALIPLLTATFIGTVSNNIVNVPLRDIVRDFKVPLPEGVLVVVAFALPFAVLMPLTGWLGDRLGRRRVLCSALIGLAIGAVGAASAQSFGVLIAFRVLQGVSTAAVLPPVMGLIADLFGPVRRGRALGVWAAVNGIGQAVGPPLGGLFTDWLSWRWMFIPIVPLALVALLGTWRLVPAGKARPLSLDWSTAVALTVGTTLVIAAVTAVPLRGVPKYVPVVLAMAGVVALALFAASARRAADPFISPSLIREPSYLRSSLAVFAQMFCLGATLLAVPLYLTAGGAASAVVAGVLVFAFPATMAVLAPVSGLLTESFGPRRVIRSGLVVLVVSQALLGLELTTGGGRGVDLIGALLVAGVGVAFVQTPAATGATRAPAGRAGAGLGLFNLIRFTGSALGAAWVAIVIAGSGSFGLLFGTSAVLAGLGLAGTYLGQGDTQPAGSGVAEHQSSDLGLPYTLD